MENPFESIHLRLDHIEQLLLELKKATGLDGHVNDKSIWMDLEALCDYIPDKPAKATVYGWVTHRKIPFHKGLKKLRFLKSEIDEWLLKT